MRTPSTFGAVSAALLAALSASGCERGEATPPRAASIVGTWLVHDPNAPFPYHLYVFNGDGTMHQANPDAGDPRTSDSDGKGAWKADGNHVQGKWVEVMADRVTHQYTGRLEISMNITVAGDSLTATEVVGVFDSTGAAAPTPSTPQTLRGVRIVPR